MTSTGGQSQLKRGAARFACYAAETYSHDLNAIVTSMRFSAGRTVSHVWQQGKQVTATRDYIKIAGDVSIPVSYSFNTPELFASFEISPLLSGEIASGWQLKKPLMLKVEVDDDGSMLISDAVFDEYGTGETFAEAKQDYIQSLIAYYDLLQTWATDDHPETQALFDYLRTYLQPDN